MEDRMNSCPPIPEVADLLSTDNNYVEVNPLDLIPGENVILYHKLENYIGCAKIISRDIENNRIKYRLNSETVNVSTVDEYIPSTGFKFFRKNFDKKNYNEIIAPLSEKGQLPKGPSGKVFGNKDTNYLIGTFLGNDPYRGGKITRKKRRKTRKSRKNKRNTKRRTR